VAQTRREFLEKSNQIVGGLSGAPQASGKPKLAEGVRVRLKGIRQPAKVRRVLADGLIEVEAGFMKMQVSVDDVEEVLPIDTGAPALPRGIRFDQAQGPKWDVSYREISVIGKHAEEAADEVDKFLDSAALANVDRVRIVHGHGMGILKRTISDLLAHNPHVEKFYPASPSEGGAGATIAELKV
jgi:DNA mismatch repair protein MutS2